MSDETLMPGGNPESEQTTSHKAPSVDIPLIAVEEFLTGARPATTECAEQAFDQSLDELAKRENPLPLD